MKKSFTFLTASALIFGFSVIGFTNSGQPPAAHTGAPGEMSCTMCHSGNPTSNGSVALLLPPANYVPGTTYPLTIRVSDPAKTRFGFEMVALRSGNAQAGMFTLATGTNNVSILINGTKRYAAHNNASNNNTWTVNWTAPATDVGPVTFYMAGNAANGNGSTSGDNIYQSSFVLNSAPTGIQEDKNGFISVYPNPASGKIFINLAEETTGLKVLDIQGREVLKNEKAGNLTQLDVSKLDNGIYFLQLDMKNSSLVKRFVVQH